MNFIQNDDFIIIVEWPSCRLHEMIGRAGDRDDLSYCSIEQDDLSRIRECGPKTVFYPLFWTKIEPRMGEYDWSSLDDQVEKCKKAGMKLLLGNFTFGPIWAPDEWMPRANPPHVFAGRHKNFSIWNMEAQSYWAEFTRAIAARYVCDSVKMACTQSVYGEAYLDAVYERFDIKDSECFYDDAAAESYRRFSNDDSIDIARIRLKERTHPQVVNAWLRKSIVETMVGKNKLMVELNGCGDVWHFAHHAWGRGTRMGLGAPYIRDVLSAYKSEIPGVKVNGIQWEYWTKDVEPYRSAIRHDGLKYDIDFFVGAEYCQGLRTNTPRLIRENLRGFILNPLANPGYGYTSNISTSVIKPWKLDNIRWAHRLLAGRRKYSSE